MFNLKDYLLGRADSVTAWIGFIGLFLEFFLHPGNASFIMFGLFVALIVLPESKFRDIFGGWTSKVREFDKK